MAGVTAVIPKVQLCNSLGLPMIGGTLDVYLAGTTTRSNSYQDKALGSANTNPIALDSRGECLLWLDPTLTYKFVLKNALGVTQWTVDNIAGAEQAGLRELLAASGGSALVGFSHAITYADGTIGAKDKQIVSVKDAPYNATGDGTTDDTAAILAAMDAAFAQRKSVYIPAGTYKITSSIAPTLPNALDMPFPGGMGIHGDGLGASKLLYTGASGYCLDFTTSQSHVDSFTCQDFAIRVSDDAGSAGGIRMPQGSGQRFIRMWFEGAGATGTGLKLDGVYGGGLYNYSCLIDGCRFWKYTNFAGQWLVVDGSITLAIKNSFFSVTTYAGAASYFKTCRQLNISNTQFESNHSGTVAGQYLISLDDVLGGTIENPWFEGLTHAAAIKIAAGCRNIKVVNPYHYHDNLSGNFIYSVCDAPVRVENLTYQQPAGSPSGVLLNHVSGFGHISFSGDYVDLIASGKLLGAQGDTNTNQPCFAAEVSAGVTNVTGDSTDYTLIPDTELYDLGANYNNATGVFTAPVAGKYLFTVQVYVQNLGAAHTIGSILLNAGTRGYYMVSANLGACRDVTNSLLFSGCAIADMAVGTTASVVLAANNGTKTIGVGATYTRFEGVLLT